MEKQMENKIEIWQRQPDEPETEYQLFEKYLYMGGKRSFGYVAAISGKSKRTIARYNSRWNWIIRANAYDEYIRQNHKLGLYEYCKEMEIQKFFLKMEFSAVAKDVFNRMKILLDSSDSVYSNPLIYKKLKFYRDVTETAKKIYTLIDFDPHPEIYVEKLNQDIILNNNVKQTMDGDPNFKLSKFQDFQHFLDYFTKFIKKKNEALDDNNENDDNDDNDDTQCLSDSNSNNNKDLQKDLMSIIYDAPASPDDNYLEEYYHRTHD